MSTLKLSEYKSLYAAPGHPHEFVVMYTADEHWMEFLALKVEECEKVDGKLQLVIGKQQAIESGESDTILLHGSIKWDGCINLDIGGRRQSYRNHFCNLRDALIVERALRAVYALAAEHITAWYGDEA